MKSMGLKRRTFLQQAGLALTAWGVSEVGLSALATRYQQVLAQPTRRKLALLVGINQYPEQVCDCAPVRGSALAGCVTDVELQQELLIHRFGFQPSDILTLTDEQATRDAIESAFLAHLTEQARSGDVVIFHFSGFGSRINLPSAANATRYSLVPVDGLLPTDESPDINDILDDTLVLLLRSLPTDQITTIIDASYADPGALLQGNLRMRSRPNVPSGRIAEAELAVQETLLERSRLSPEQLQSQWQLGQFPGVMLMAAGTDQVAAEGQWNGFSAGLFTYALTQQLWWTTPATTLRVNLGRAVGSVKQLVGSEQQPDIKGLKSQEPVVPPFYTKPITLQGADGVITAIGDDGKTVQLWLAGLPASVLENYGVNSLLSLYQADIPDSDDSALDFLLPDAKPTSPVLRAELQVRSRDGLTVRARPYSTELFTPPPLEAGQLVQESVRFLPRNVGLTIALDASLERIERVDAISAFAAIPRISSVVAGEQPADYVFGKKRPSPRTVAASEPIDPFTAASPIDNPSAPPVHSSYGLFYPGRAAIPSTLIGGDEAVKTAVNRLTSQLKILLATKLIRLTLNEGSSRLGVRATLEMVAPHERIIMHQETIRAPWTAPQSRLASLLAGNGIPTLPIGSRIQFRLNNYSDRPTYYILLGLDTSGSAIALYPAVEGFTDGEEEQPSFSDRILAPGATVTIPQPTAADWAIQGPTGFAEAYIIFSRTPFTQAFSALEMAMRSKGDARRVNVLLNPLEVAQAILHDLHHASLTTVKADVPTDTYALDVNTWATLSFVYRIADV